MRKAKVVRGEELVWEPGQEPPLKAKRGICTQSVEKPDLKMYRMRVPAGARNQRHYHVKCDAGMHILKGSLRIFIGPDHQIEETIAEAGDFIFVPAGVIHGFMNLSDTEEVELVSAKNNVSEDSQEGTVFVEPSWVKQD